MGNGVMTMSDRARRAKLSVKDIREETGLGQSTVSEILNGKYAGKPETVKLVEEIISRYEEHDDEWKTREQEVMKTFLRWTMQDKSFTLILADSGHGKTHIVEEFASHNPGVFVWKVVQNVGFSDMLGKMLETMGSTGKSTVGQKIYRLFEQVKRKGYKMLIIDEADHLVVRQRPKDALKHLSVFRELRDNCDIPVVLTGLPSMMGGIQEGDSYITSRFGYIYEAKNPAMDEMVHFWTDILGMSMDRNIEIFIRNALNRGCFRKLETLASRAKDLGSIEMALNIINSR